MEHLLNCHGEWNFLIAILATMPAVGPWVRARLRRPCGHTTHPPKE